MKLRQVFGLLSLGVALSGCATIVDGTTQSVSVSTTPDEGANCTLSNTEGTWYLTTPGSVTVHKTKNDLSVHCSKSGYQDANQTVNADFGGATFGNIVAGGLIGAGVDAASGADYSYQSPIGVPMARLAQLGPSSQPATATTSPDAAASYASASVQLVPGNAPGLGIDGATVTASSIAAVYMENDPHGVAINSVKKGSPAEKANIRPGDVIVSFAKHRVEGVNDLDKWSTEPMAGSSVPVQLNRDGKLLTINVEY